MDHWIESTSDVQCKAPLVIGWMRSHDLIRWPFDGYHMIFTSITTQLWGSWPHGEKYALHWKYEFISGCTELWYLKTKVFDILNSYKCHIWLCDPIMSMNSHVIPAGHVMISCDPNLPYDFMYRMYLIHCICILIVRRERERERERERALSEL